ncbi:MAG: Fe-S protein [Rhodospirillaceae bacterium]|nr:Fe-S protein [Rhodospirillaceae bacterium]MBT7361860.1 Fe-S protein [Rhodospirillaceae bacterium]
MHLLKNGNRPFHLGPFPLETLPRDDTLGALEISRPAAPPAVDRPAAPMLGEVTRKFRDMFAGFASGDVAPATAPDTDDVKRCTVDIMGAAYFLDASQAGICLIPENAWRTGSTPLAHSHAIVIMVEHSPVPGDEPLSAEWTRSAVVDAAEMRATEIAVNIAGHIRLMGYDARADVPGDRMLDEERLAVLAGIAIRNDDDSLANPYIKNFTFVVISTEYQLECDRPLAVKAMNAKGLRYWWGINDAQSGRERNRRAKRPSHASRYPMETVKRVDRPTTLILDDEVPRVPKRAAFFERALQGDLGDKAQRERARFATKHPLARSMVSLIRAMVPHQDGNPTVAPDMTKYADPAQNTKALKALSYFLGADLTGVCEIPRYAWYSHKDDGSEIEMYHKYAVVMLIDQGFDTMEGASGDDWISGGQSMRGYQRGAEISGVMAHMLGQLGFSARAQTNADSDVLQIPLVLLAGLGEMSRIGELVLNPFVGPRFKSVVLTTDMPLDVDKPIDFGLQTFCNGCLKCARECPCDAIPFGDKVMFNGYEIWKPDAERCVRYRLTNPHGSACGRCMKTCPINKVVDSDGALLTRLASWLGVNALFLKPIMVPLATWLDDAIGNGRRNLNKKWWFDHEVVGDRAVAPKGVNQREIDPSRKVDPAKQRMAYYHANMMPPPDTPDPVPVERKAAMAAGALMETPDEAEARAAAGGPAPAHYTPTPPMGAGAAKKSVKNPYAADFKDVKAADAD